VALALAAYYLFTWLVALPWCASTGCGIFSGANELSAYFIGILVLVLYVPIYLIRRYQDRSAVAVGGSSGGQKSKGG
jgi:hypothetical protein